MKNLIAALACVSAMAVASAAAAQPTSAALAAVWAQEDRYWTLAMAGDQSRSADYLKLFDDRFMGWPCGSPTPATKAWITFKDLVPGVKHSVARDEQAWAGGNDYLVVYYRAKVTSQYPDGKTEVDARDYTHTWVLTPDGWRIIGGMCREEPAAAQ